MYPFALGSARIRLLLPQIARVNDARLALVSRSSTLRVHAQTFSRPNSVMAASGKTLSKSS